jgi:hypothetical protein
MVPSLAGANKREPQNVIERAQSSRVWHVVCLKLVALGGTFTPKLQNKRINLLGRRGSREQQRPMIWPGTQ